MELSDLTEEQKIELFKLVKKTYLWAERPGSVRAAAKNFIKTGKFKI